MNRFNYLVILCSIAPNLYSVQGADLATVSITAAPDFLVQQTCVKDALYEDAFGELLGLPLYLGCTSTVYNACFCTSAVEGQASSILSREVSENCAGTSQISEALSVYDDYCISAGYPRNDGNAASATTTAEVVVSTGGAETSHTPTVNSETATSTEPINESATSTPGFSSSTSQSSQSSPSSPSTSPSSQSSPSTSNQANQKSNPNIGAIIGGTLGGLALIAVILLLVLLLVRSKPRRSAEAVPNSSVVSETLENRKAFGGRAELENNKTKKPPTVITQPVPENRGRTDRMENMNIYGLRPEEMDANGRNIAQLHGDGRYPGNIGVELPGSQGFGAH